MYDNAHDVPTAMSEVVADFEPATPEDVRNVIRKTPDKSYELDPILTRLLKQCLNELIPLVIAIINRSMETGSVPMCFKSCLNPEILKNYRPVSNLPFFTKI